MTNVARAAEIISRTMLAPSFSAPESRMLDAADALAKEGLLAPDLQIIRTREELAALDPDTLLASTVETQYAFSAEEPQEMLARGRRVGIGWIPAVVLATGEQVRAARQALDSAE